MTLSYYVRDIFRMLFVILIGCAAGFIVIVTLPKELMGWLVLPVTASVAIYANRLIPDTKA